MKRIRWRIFVAVCLAIGAAAPAASAQPKVDDDTRFRARTLGEEGNDLFDSGDYAAALDRYQRAAALVSVPTLGLRIGRCLERLHRLVEASERYLAVTRMTLPADALDIHREAVASAETERAALLPRIPSLVLQVSGTGSARVTLDGKELPAAVIGVKLPADPGTHRVEARRGDAVDSRDVNLAEGATVTLTLDPRGGAAARTRGPAPREEPASPSWLSTRHAVGLGLIALGVGGLAVGGVTSGIAAGKKSELEKVCGVELQCPPAAYADADAYNRILTVSSIGWIAGGAVTALGIVLVVIPSSKPTGKETSLRIAPSGLAVTGSF